MLERAHTHTHTYKNTKNINKNSKKIIALNFVHSEELTRLLQKTAMRRLPEADRSHGIDSFKTWKWGGGMSNFLTNASWAHLKDVVLSTSNERQSIRS